MVCGNQAACCGNQEAICGITGGELVVSGDINKQVKAMICCGNQAACCGNQKAGAGYFERMSLIPIRYEVPVSGYWSLLFFVGGPATRNISGEITSIDLAVVPTERRTELIENIVKYKPMFSWAGLIVNFT